MAASIVMFKGRQFETINDMVHSLRPVRLRQLTTVKKVFVQKSEIAQKKKKKKKRVQKAEFSNASLAVDIMVQTYNAKGGGNW